MQFQQLSKQSLENQINQWHGKLPSDTQEPRMEDRNDCKVIELRSRKELHDPYKLLE